MASRDNDKALKEAFGKKLERLTADKGWNQSELARQASLHLSNEMTRDSVSKYMRGYNWPSPSHRSALAKALGVQVSTLTPEAVERATSIEVLPGGMARLYISTTIKLDAALKIMSIIESQAK